MTVVEVVLTPHGGLDRRARCGPRVTHHAVERYIDRVEPSATRYQADAAITWIVRWGHVRSTPRHWMRGRVRQTPGLRYVYLAELPGVCALVRDGVVVTIVTRHLYRETWRPLTPGEVGEPIYCRSIDHTRSLEFEVAA